MPVLAGSAAPLRSAATPRSWQPPATEVQASDRVAVVMFAIVVACLAIFAAWGVAALRARRRARARARKS
jgi:hypothetical protein